jgi:hypothetical protein
MVAGFPELVYQAQGDKQLDLGPTASSLDLLQAIYRDPSIALTTRMRAAMAALPHEVPRLAVTAQITEQDFATLLDRRLKRLEELKLLEANGAKAIDGKPQAETKPPVARTNDRRFRRY